MNKKLIFYIVFSLVCLIGFYFLVFYKNDYINEKKYITINHVKPFEFLNQYGEKTNQEVLKNKVAVIEFFFTTCQGICPKMNVEFHKLYKQYGNRNDFILLSHTVQPEIDSVQQLFKYAQQFNIKNKNWLFLTGEKNVLYNQARLSYSLDDPKNNVGSIADQFLHTQFFALVNKRGDVIGIYDSLLPSEIKELVKNIDFFLNQ